VTPTPTSSQQQALDAEGGAYRGRLKRKEASVGTTPSPSSQGIYSPSRKGTSSGGVRAVLNARAAAAAAASAQPGAGGASPSSRSKSLPPSDDRQQQGGASRVPYYRDSSDTELGDTSTSELDENRSWSAAGMDSDSASSDYVDPSLRKEISWSVSQLRALFGGGANANPGAGTNPSPTGEYRMASPSSSIPPPYRHPPSRNSYFEVKGHSAHKTASSDSGWSTSSPRHARSDSPSSSSNGEESYV
jgi:hypothetical protein